MTSKGPEPDAIKRLYESSKEVWPKNDLWHDKTRIAIESQVMTWLSSLPIAKSSKILNAGAGTTRYSVNCNTYDNDIVGSLVENSPNPIVSSIEKIPVKDEFFDVCVCVGSVLNYCDAFATISELARVLPYDGYLILEFERSDSAEFLFSKRHHNAIFPKQYQYNEQKHDLWLYSEKYVTILLKDAGFLIKSRKRFHSASSLIYRLTKDQNQAAKYIKYDSICGLLSYHLAHNVIMLLRKN